MLGLAPKTLKVFEEVTQLRCIKDYVLVGGTALSLQIKHRLSEDLDFCKWINASTAKDAIPFNEINKELKDKFDSVVVNPIDFDQVDYIVNDEVKIQFFNETGYSLPSNDNIALAGSLKIAPIVIIGAMKIKTMFQRNVFRDYYDVYAIVNGGHMSLSELIRVSCIYDKRLTKEMIINRLHNHKKFREEKNFGILSPGYNVNSSDIGEFFNEKSSGI
jgi:predicted nucleotidyltransferase component of viral defense system